MIISFQFKIVHRILCTNIVLKKRFKITNNDQCTFCSVQLETASHLLWECAIVNSLWHNLKDWLKPVINIEQYLNCKSILLEDPYTGTPLGNLIILRTTYFIYCRKCCGQNLNIQGLKQCLIAEYE